MQAPRDEREATADAISRARARASAHLEIAADVRERGEIRRGHLCDPQIAADGIESGEIQRAQLCVILDLLYTHGHAPAQQQQGRLSAMSATADAISRARAASVSAHLEIAADVCEHGEIQSGQLCVPVNLTHALPRDSYSASGQDRRDAHDCCGRDQPSVSKRERAPGRP